MNAARYWRIIAGVVMLAWMAAAFPATGNTAIAAGTMSITGAGNSAISGGGVVSGPPAGGYQLATISDSDSTSLTPADITLKVDWGDSTTTTCPASNGATQCTAFSATSPNTTDLKFGACTGYSVNTCTVFGDHTYANPGRYKVTVTATDNDTGETVSTTDTIYYGVVVTGNCSGVSANSTCTSQSQFVGPSGTEPYNVNGNVAYLTDGGPLTSGNYSNTIDWGDGSTPTTNTNVPASCAADGCFITGSHTYGDYSASPYNITVVETTPNGGTGSSGTTGANADGTNSNTPLAITVADAPLNEVAHNDGIQASPNVTTTGSNTYLGTFHDGVNNAGDCAPSDYNVTVDWGDGSPTDTFTGTQVVSSSTTNPGTCNFDINADHTYKTATGSPFYPHVTVTEANNQANAVDWYDQATVAASSGDLTFTPASGPLFGGALAAPNTVTLGTFQDPDQGGTGSLGSSAYTASIAWGDSTTTNGTITCNNTTLPGTCTVTGLHQYAKAGRYQPKVTITDTADASEPAASGSDYLYYGVVVTSDCSGLDPTSQCFKDTFLSGTKQEGQRFGTSPLPSSDIVAFVTDGGSSTACPSSVSVDWGGPYAEYGWTFTCLSGDGGAVSGYVTYIEPGTNNVVTSMTYGTDGQGDDSADPLVLTSTEASLDEVSHNDAIVGTTGTPLPGNTNLGVFHDEINNSYCPLTNSSSKPTYIIDVDWGDTKTSSNDPTAPDYSGSVGVSAYNDGNQCDFEVTGTHTYQNPGTYTIHVTIQEGPDPLVITDTATIGSPVTMGDLTVTGGYTIQDTEGAETTQAIGYMSDPDAPLANITLNANDGAITWTANCATGCTTDSGTGTLFLAKTVNCNSAPTSAASAYVCLDATFNEARTSPITLTVKDSGTGDTDTTGTEPAESVTVSSAADVVDAQLTPVQQHIDLSTTPHVQPGSPALTSTTLLGVFHDTDNGNDCQAADYTASLDWGDGTPADTTPTDFTITPAAGTCNFDVNYVGSGHTYAKSGTYAPTVTVVDADEAAGNASTTLTDSIQIGTSDLTITPNAWTSGEYQQEAHVLAQVTDPDGQSDLAATVSWGDGSTNDSCTATSGAGGCYLTGSNAGATLWFGNSSCAISATAADNTYLCGRHRYKEAGSYPISTQITDTDGSEVAGPVSDQATVNDLPLNKLTDGKTFTGNSGTAVAAGATLGSFVDTVNTSDDCATAGEYNVSIDWGDGSTVEPGTLTGAGCTFNVIAPAGGHTYAKNGTYPITVTVTDPDNISNPQTVTLNDTAQIGAASDLTLNTDGISWTPVESNSYTHAVAKVSDPDMGSSLDSATSDLSFNVTFDDGTGSHTCAGATCQAGSAPNGVWLSQNKTCNTTPAAMPANTTTAWLCATHTFTDPGSYTLTVNVTDADSGSLSGNLDATVSDAPLVNIGHNDAIGGQPGQPVTMTTIPAPGTGTGVYLGTFQDTVAANGGSDPDCTTPTNYKLSVAWGDGTSSTTGFVIQPASSTTNPSGLPCTFDVYSTTGHTYTTKGSYQPVLTVTDQDVDSHGNDVTPQTVQITDAAQVGNTDLVVTGGYTYTAVEGQAPYETLANFSDADYTGPNYTITV
ncbi:MAG: hypothetical protein ACRDFS_09445, partial [Chloroflexota bacterium]